MPFSFYDKREYEERYGEEVGRCNIHKVQIVDRSCDLCADALEDMDKSEDEIAWICKECGERREDDARVEAGMKCGVCAYA